MGMIDVSKKEPVARTAVAQGSITLRPETVRAITDRKIAKGDVFTVAEVACLSAIKRTPELIAYCHQIPIDSVDVKFTSHEDKVTVTVTVKALAKTGVEMEALTGAAVALLSVWDMVKYLEKDADGQYPKTCISDIRIHMKAKGDAHDRETR
jgi:cyclic pyranopterin monophosphate synthase